MTSNENFSEAQSRTMLLDRRLVTCSTCGWVHYVMTRGEKAVNDRLLEHLTARYQLSREEQELYESAYRQCLRCESPADNFRAATERDIDRAQGHIVTPVFVAPEVGAQ